jgi:signal transduction histidine kinase/CheY-like chemotaxis protein/HPt (histidine-containing phosphotransfer) domain-containing protein
MAASSSTQPGRVVDVAVGGAAEKVAPQAISTKTVWALRSIFLASLLLFCILPASLVGWVLYRSNLQTVDVLADKILSDVTTRIQLDTEEHLRQADTVFNGLIPTQPNEADILNARSMIANPRQFEQAAFALTRMTPNVPYMYFGSAKGDFLGVELVGRRLNNEMRIGVRQHGDAGRRFYTAQSVGDRSQPDSTEAKNYEPRSRPWYQTAMENKGRAFSPVYISASKKQLVITLAQPVYGDDGGAVGVMAADLYLRRLSEQLQSTTISARGTAFLIDDKGYLIASSAGDDLLKELNGKMERVQPDSSKNAIIRTAYADVAASLNKTLEDSVQRIKFTRRVAQIDDDLIVTLQPFGENLGLRWSLVVAAPEADFTAKSQAALKKTGWVMAAAVALGAALATWLAYRLTRRFRALAHAAQELGRGQVPALEHNTHIREVRTLSSAMHSSAQELVRNRAALQAQANALQDANEHLEERVSQRTAELEASRQEALGAARAKAAFLATMSHEIRTPLNGVVGMTTLLADTPLNPEQRDYVHTMRVSSDQLLGVINDILDFSKIESGKLDLENEVLHLQATIEEACDIAAPRAREKGLELLVDFDDHVPTWVRGDVTRLRQVLLNFINNAIKFTDKGQVVVSVNVQRDLPDDQSALLEFRVKDSGIGIPADRMSALFQSFTQVDASTTRKYGGTGLGLAICKRLAEIMQGKVGVESVLGEGSTFWFTAKLGHAQAPDQSQSSMLHMVSLKGKTAVVVDDTPLNLRILDKQLKRWGMLTVLFERAQPALDWLAHNTCDVVVTDMHMPDMDGQIFTETLRGRQKDAHVVLLTSGTMPTGEAAKVFDARLLKPYRQSQLFDAIGRVTAELGPLAALPTAQGSKDQRILVADDNAVNLKVALAMLGKLGYEAATAINGREAVDLVTLSLRPEGKPFAAVLMDANMPVMDGFEASRLIVAGCGEYAPPIIAVTASVLEEDRQRCLDAGMRGFLPKPLRIDELSEALARYAVQNQSAPKIIAANAVSIGIAEVKTSEKAVVLMDWSRLEQFKEFDDDDRSMTREVVALFVNDAPIRMDDIRQALRGSDSGALSRAAHALKGAASNVGATALTDACFALEQSCHQGHWPSDAAQQVAQLADLAQQTRQALQDWKL